MGMFDDIKCEMDLPGNPNCDDFQTKSFPEPYLEKYTITKDGYLMKDHKKIEYHGVLSFYGTTKDTKRWCEFDAKFTDGKCLSITPVNNRIILANKKLEGIQESVNKFFAELKRAHPDIVINKSNEAGWTARWFDGCTPEEAAKIGPAEDEF